MNKSLRFNTSTNIKSLLGKNLVTDQTAAIFELVKNSYDADATEVNIIFKDLSTNNPKLIISDNGSGMNLDDIQNKWMVIGTDSKQHTLYSPLYKRPLNGDKGIGRFSVDRLGSKLHLESVKRGSKECIDIKFDWDDFENEFKPINEIEIPYDIEIKEDVDNGVTLTIHGLRDVWDKLQIDKLKKDLRKFKSPFENNDVFKIFIDAPDLGYKKNEITCEKLENISSLWIDIICKTDDPSKVYMTIWKDGLEYEEIAENKYNFGPVRARVYYFNQGDKVRFKNRYSYRVRDFGNITLYRDEFRIHPYGDPLNDWLSLDRRQLQGFQRFFGTRDLIGYIQTYKEFNTGLIPLTNRQGLVDNEDYRKLTNFIKIYTVEKLEEYFFKKFKKNSNETIIKSRHEVNSAVGELKNIANNLKQLQPEDAKKIKAAVNIIAKEQNNQLRYIKDQEELTKVYSRIAKNETLLNKIIHQTLLDLVSVSKASKHLERSVGLSLSNLDKICLEKIIKGIDEGMKKLLTVRDDIVRKRVMISLNMGEEITSILSNYTEIAEYHIHVTTALEENVIYKMDRSDLKSIMLNLLSNSVKSLRKVDRERKIFIELKKTDRFIVIKVQDNGVGIEEDLRERIFDPFITTTGEFGGFGIGLTIVDDVMKEYSGHLELVDVDEVGACFLVKLRC